MPIERGGFLTIVEDELRDGVRQSASESVRRYSLLQNVHLFNRDAITKDLGIRRMHSSDIASGADVLGGFDARFRNGAQKVVVVNASDAHLYNTTTKQFVAQSQSLANARPDQFMFADKMLLLNGTNFKSMTSSGTWANVTGSPPAAKFGTVHANRAIVSGVSGSEHLFYPSGINDENSWDATLAVVVEGSEGSSGITNLGRLGSTMIVQTSRSTHSYTLSSENPRDWDNTDVAGTVGNVHHRTWVEVDTAAQGEDQAAAFFWSTDGPCLITMPSHGGRPSVVSLMDPIMRSTRGSDYQNFPALNVGRFANIESTYVPELGQVRFGVAKKASAENDLILWIDVESAIAFSDGEIEYPYWGLRKSDELGYFPCDVLFTAQVDEAGVPSTTGMDRCIGGRNGVFFEMDAPGTFDDNGQSISFDVRRRGYDGSDEGVRVLVKAIKHTRVRATQVGGGELYVDLIADGGNDSGTATLNLDAGLTTWDGSSWDGGTWNDGALRTLRGDYGVLGERFEVRLYDNGNISEPFQLDGWQLEGFLEDRR
ncbi:hypothetical protein [uncultured Mediterranean phage]|nr:hypothetical protein [uncultured Mediterranean phage]